MSAPAQVAPVAPSDYAALADFLASFPGLESPRDFWLSRFRLWWQSNPACAGVPAGWLLRESGAIKGFLGNLPSQLMIAGRPATVFSITSWMVLPEYRDHSLALLMEHMRAAEKSLLFDTTPTAEVAAILESLGFEPLPWAGERESFLVLDWQRCLAAAAPGLAGKALSIGATALAAWQARRLRPLQDTGLPGAAESAQISEEFDRLWQRTSGLYANTNVRNAAALRWHFLMDAHVEKKVFVRRHEGELAGYLALKARTRRGLKSLDCVDFWENPGVPMVLESLLAAAWRHAQSRSLDLLTFPHFTNRLGERLRRAGLFSRASGRRALFLAPPELRAEIRAENSCFVGLQGDYGTAVS